ncbi:METTL5 family protein [Candidatus Woesearchaeota archaeon]|nr:METTL5 family protein [Candidatus Woesearchaeota archaeon]
MAKSESSNRAKIGSKGALAVVLSKLEGFGEPKVSVEQYATDAEIAAEVLWQAFMKGDIGKVSVDLGCGTGILGIGMLLLGAEKVFFVDSDKKVLGIAEKNIEKVKSEGYKLGEAVFICKDVEEFNEKADLVVQNPPFGVKVRHMDKVFLNKAFEISSLVYSFHKSESKRFVEAISKDNGFKVTDVWDFEFPLKATLSYHTRRIKRIGVSCFRIEKAYR